MKTNCGCTGKTSPEDKKYLMVEMTGSEAATCDPDQAPSGVEDCAKQEPTYDESLSDFVVPLSTNTTQLQVCNSSIYTLSQYIQFAIPRVRMLITANNADTNILTIANRCPDGSAIPENPEAGLAVPEGSRFSVVDSPQCPNTAQDIQKVKDALAGMSELCVPELTSAPSTSKIYVVGRVDEDVNPAQGKCIRWITSLWNDAGKWFMTEIRLLSAASSQFGAYRKLGRHSTTNEIVEFPNYKDMTDVLGGGKQMALAISEDGERLVGPAYFFNPFHYSVDKNDNDLDPDLWPSFSNTKNETYDLSGSSQISDTVYKQDHYFALVRLEIAGISTGDYNTIEASLNDSYAGRVITRAAEEVQYNSITMPVKILKSNNELKLKLETNGSVKVFYRVIVDGIFI